jgi:hypothetical protein
MIFRIQPFHSELNGGATLPVSFDYCNGLVRTQILAEAANPSGLGSATVSVAGVGVSGCD